MIKLKILLTIIGTIFAGSSFAIDMGLGLSSSMDGRYTPALSVSQSVGGKYLLTGSTAGVQTKSYYHNSYTLSALKVVSLSKTLFGKPVFGFGIGGHYGLRGYSPNPEDESVGETRDVDKNWGPAFRIALYPIERIFIESSFVMGITPGILGLGFADTGVFAIGVSI